MSSSRQRPVIIHPSRSDTVHSLRPTSSGLSSASTVTRVTLESQARRRKDSAPTGPAGDSAETPPGCNSDSRTHTTNWWRSPPLRPSGRSPASHPSAIRSSHRVGRPAPPRRRVALPRQRRAWRDVDGAQHQGRLVRVQARFEPHHAVLAWAQLHPAALTVGTLVRDLLDSPAQRLDLRRARAEELDEVGPAVIHCHRKLFLGASGQTWGQLSDQILE